MAYRLSVVMIARNAADTLEECLKSVDWADEVILLDSGSTDDTMAIASAHGAGVYSSPDWQGFGTQRQRAQSYATGDYILMIDTDERVTPELKSAIQSVLSTPPGNTVYAINRRNLFLGRFMRHSGWYPDRVTRLYAREKYQYNSNQVHESLDAPGAPQTRLQGDFIHLTCRDLSVFQAKQLQYATAWAHERHQQGKQTSVISIFTHTIGAFVKTLLLRGGVLDGKQGWILAVVNAQYTFNKYAELWALNHGYTEKQP